MGETLIKSRDTSLELDEDLRKEGLLVIKIGNESPPVAWLSGEITIDARAKVDSRHSNPWINKDEGDKLGKLFEAVRTACCSSGGNREAMNELLLRAGKTLGLNATCAVVVGEVPDHWKEKNNITRQYFKRPEDLAKLYPPLD